MGKNILCASFVEIGVELFFRLLVFVLEDFLLFNSVLKYLLSWISGSFSFFL